MALTQYAADHWWIAGVLIDAALVIWVALRRLRRCWRQRRDKADE